MIISVEEEHLKAEAPVDMDIILRNTHNSSIRETMVLNPFLIVINIQTMTRRREIWMYSGSRQLFKLEEEEQRVFLVKEGAAQRTIKKIGSLHINNSISWKKRRNSSLTLIERPILLNTPLIRT